MHLTLPIQKSRYWRVFGLCFLLAAALFLPHCIADAFFGGGYFHYAGDFNDQQINFYQYANAFVKQGGSFSWPPTWAAGSSIPIPFICWAAPFSGSACGCPPG